VRVPFSTEHVRHRRGTGLENRCAHQGVPSAILGCSANSKHRTQSCGQKWPHHITFPSVAQQQSTRLITGRPWSVTTPRDSFFHAGWLRQMSGGLKLRRGWRATNSSDHAPEREYSTRLTFPAPGSPFHHPCLTIEMFRVLDTKNLSMASSPPSLDILALRHLFAALM